MELPVSEPLSQTLQLIFKASTLQLGIRSYRSSSNSLPWPEVQKLGQTQGGNMRPGKGGTLYPTLNKVLRRGLLTHAKNFSTPRKARDKPGCQMNGQNLNWLPNYQGVGESWSWDSPGSFLWEALERVKDLLTVMWPASIVWGARALLSQFSGCLSRL